MTGNYNAVLNIQNVENLCAIITSTIFAFPHLHKCKFCRIHALQGPKSLYLKLPNHKNLSLYQSVQIWNSIPANIKLFSYPKFKSLYKN